MKLVSTYSVKIKEYNRIFKDTVKIYRNAVDFIIQVCLSEWDDISKFNFSNEKMTFVEKLIHQTKDNTNPKYDFDSRFYKMPTYIRRAAIHDAIGQASSYKSNYENWLQTDMSNKAPSQPKSGFAYPTLYIGNMFEQTGLYQAKIKIYKDNTWKWLEVNLKKSDMDYINNHCLSKHRCAPTIQKRGKQWFLDFPFEETVALNKTDIKNQIIVAVDLGINTDATCCVMTSDGTVLKRYFYNLKSDKDHLNHCINRIKKAQQNRNHKTPRLWNKAKGVNRHIAEKTAQFIYDIACANNADVIVFEYLELNHKVKGKRKYRQKFHMWKARAIQSIVSTKAHRNGIRISHVNARNTSRLAFDGSGIVTRGNKAGFTTYELCRFTNNKIYNCDLSASYNIGARYFIRELLKSCSVKNRLLLQAKVPEVNKRTTCTLSTLISCNVVMYNKSCA